MRVTEADKVRLKQLKEKGKSYEQIHRITGFSITTIRRWTNEEYRAKAKRNNLARYHRVKDDPIEKARVKLKRQKRLERYGCY
ncbi:hypothetical protein EVC27_066 [Rhizobium phage RHph_I1_6]|uniref:Uncharacterized protein n=1 Tax=Rhizobium phage RHph_I1_6 TaxID=2509728 RepID=A0A7S5RIW2_9CAUD|nr:hypothetical protein PP745_gp066 [Rhizobium phage RHph_I1_6]QIG76591.1 hypothetical protein EVC27_066 [Rhizobium phage RHph_I1_6]